MPSVCCRSCERRASVTLVFTGSANVAYSSTVANTKAKNVSIPSFHHISSVVFSYTNNSYFLYKLYVYFFLFVFFRVEIVPGIGHTFYTDRTASPLRPKIRFFSSFVVIMADIFFLGFLGSMQTYFKTFSVKEFYKTIIQYPHNHSSGSFNMISCLL